MILVTGGLGYIGSHTAVELIEQGKQVLLIDDLSNSSLKVLEGIQKITRQTVDFLKLDIKDAHKVKTLFKDHPQINGVIHFAAVKAVSESVQSPLKYYKNNIGGLLNLLEYSPVHAHFIFSSSCTVYGDAEQQPIEENTLLKRPKAPYGNTKKIGEEILEDFTRSQRKFKSLSLRYFNPVGAHDSGYIGENPKGIPQNLVPYITQAAIGKIPPLTVFGNDYPTRDGTCIRDYIHVVDLARAHVAALGYLDGGSQSIPYDVFNVGTGEGHTVLEVLDSFERVSGKKLNYSIGPRRSGDIITAYAAIDKALKHFDWSPKYSLDDAVRSAWVWVQKNRL